MGGSPQTMYAVFTAVSQYMSRTNLAHEYTEEEEEEVQTT